MTPRLTRLRISGFKSFAEPVGLDIHPGLTGIVGPNGCGKSNVVEALRWAMGETSARSLRGGEMDDVIFAGTTARASRNLAEVTVTLEAGPPEAGGAPLPAPFEAEAELQVTRRIERGAGSVFRANGRELRARDVQTLYADLASGARSSGMVSQGRVAALVGARPEERRHVLEEAAGITGLHARRHEAELKLRAAEQNVSRAGDLRTQLDASRESLRRQARQASRYRDISGLIRIAEAEHLAILHGQAVAALDRAGGADTQAAAALATAQRDLQAAVDALAAAQSAVPAQRATEAAARSRLERSRLATEALAAEAARMQQDAQAATLRLEELETDLADAGRQVADATASAARLTAECGELQARLAILPDLLATAAAHAGEAAGARAAAQSRADEAARLATAGRAAMEQAAEWRQVAQARAALCRQRYDEARDAHATCQDARIAPARLAEAADALGAAAAALADARAALDAAEAARADAESQALDLTSRARQAQADWTAAESASAMAGHRATQLAAARDAAAAALSGLADRRIGGDAVAQAVAAATRAEHAAAEAESAVDLADQGAVAARDAAVGAARACEGGLQARSQVEADLVLAQARIARLEEEAASVADALAEIARTGPDAAALATASASQRAAQERAISARATWQQAEAERDRATSQSASARGEAALAEASCLQLAAEIAGLQAALGVDEGDGGALAALHVPEGLEAAVAAALGEAGTASLDPAAPRFWRDLPASAPAVPPDGQLLGSLVQAPAALSRALACVVLMADGADGAAIQASLPQGAIAVSRRGGSWRWDGHVVRAGAQSAAAARLVLQRRLRTSTPRQADARRVATTASLAAETAGERERKALSCAEAARTACLLAEDDARAEAQRVERLYIDLSRQAADRAGLELAATRLDGERQAAAQERADASGRLDTLPNPAELDRTRLTAENAASRAETSLLAARARRQAAREAAGSVRRTAQDVAAEAVWVEARHEAALAAADHARDEADAARQAAMSAGAAWRDLPDPADLHAAAAAAVEAVLAGRASEAQARAARQAAESAFDAEQATEAGLRLAHREAESDQAAFAGQLHRSEADMREADADAAREAKRAATMPDTALLDAEAQVARDALDAAREVAIQADAQLAGHQADHAHCERARITLAGEYSAWDRRRDEAAARQAALQTRCDGARSAVAALAAAPADLAGRAARSAQAMAEAEAAHAEAAGRLEAAEAEHRSLAARERDALHRDGACRDQAIRAEASREAAAGALRAVLARMTERLGADAALPDPPDLSDTAEERGRRKFERLTREREEMGPVNLRAELELEELETRIVTLDRECEELGTAIAKLRGAIGQLNREGRERLRAVFAQVDENFRALFTRMMGGGRAHLALTGADDPLHAGLEIFAEPPGKKLSALSLLSGGEQALTALSLIFAVFRCMPAPVCVLDEVDAPLDDANVERFCALLDEMVRETGTRFLVVTHHQLTMSRMDRLYGVTMQERGVSRLLSVDLTRAAAMVEPVLQAAE